MTQQGWVYPRSEGSRSGGLHSGLLFLLKRVLRILKQARKMRRDFGWISCYALDQLHHCCCCCGPPVGLNPGLTNTLKPRTLGLRMTAYACWSPSPPQTPHEGVNGIPACGPGEISCRGSALPRGASASIYPSPPISRPALAKELPWDL